MPENFEMLDTMDRWLNVWQGASQFEQMKMAANFPLLVRDCLDEIYERISTLEAAAGEGNAHAG